MAPPIPGENRNELGPQDVVVHRDSPSSSMASAISKDLSKTVELVLQRTKSVRKAIMMTEEDEVNVGKVETVTVQKPGTSHVDKAGTSGLKKKDETKKRKKVAESTWDAGYAFNCENPRTSTANNVVLEEPSTSKLKSEDKMKKLKRVVESSQDSDDSDDFQVLKVRKVKRKVKIVETKSSDDNSDIELLDHLKIVSKDTKISVHQFDPKFMKKTEIQPIHPKKAKLIMDDFSQGVERHPVPIYNYGGKRPVDLTFYYLPKCAMDKKEFEKVMTKLSRSCKKQNIVHPPGCNCPPGECNSDSCSCRKASLLKVADGRALEPEAVAKCDPLHEILECRSGVCACNARCQQKITKPGVQFKTEMRNLDIMGYGVFAREYIEKGTFFGEYLGEIVFDAEKTHRDDGSYMYTVEGRKGKESFDYTIDARYHGNLCAYLNHSCRSNLSPFYFIRDKPHSFLFPQIGFIVTSDIVPGEEITLNYGEKYFRKDKRTCYCGLSSCEFPPKRSKAQVAEKRRNEQEQEERRRIEIPTWKKIKEQEKLALLEPVVIDSD
ncbi:unnamed protein product [Bursaphelenchus xylophilus]|uniref:(pine wood nematode) hypothetical protein n=1 Tax=Bursaphelenchus xylophilus TaxID=6326 RepID=A0A1I7RMM4_BURXY|nr:unnamed protein product [Bursaphelenchus xylophilus]CAG9125671.1 unnamed protein product [Bursaphelenchus xylophilus]